MVTTQMKTDAQRLGNGKKAFNVKQVEKMVEDAGGGTEYTAGTGIVIADDTISVDEQIVAMKSDSLKDFVLADKTQHLYAQFWDSTKHKTLKDLFIFIGGTSYVTSQVFIPKGYEGKLIRIHKYSNDNNAIVISATIKLEDVLKDVFPGNSVETTEIGFKKNTLDYYSVSGALNIISDIRIYYRP